MPESSSTSTQLDSRPPIPTACLLSDEELIASFTPQEQRLYQWHLETEEQRDYLLALISDPGAYDRFHEEAWPNREEYLAYMQWSRKWLGRHMERMFYRMPDEVFFEQLRSTNLTKEGDLGELCWTLNMCNVPLVVLGEATFDGIFTCYAIRPSSNFLYASPPLGELTKTRGDLMHENALAINLNVSTDTRGFPAVAVRDVEKEWVMKGGIEVPDSVDIHPDEPDGKTNFVFAQLGELCTYVGDWETERTKSLDDIVGGTWQLTGFGVVAEISSKGLPKALWAIYNTHLPTERLSDEEHRVHDLGGGLGGWIFKKHAARSERDTSNRFFAARITNNLMGFGPAKKLEFEIFSRSEVQIVPAMVYQVSAQQPVVVPLQVADLDSEK